MNALTLWFTDGRGRQVTREVRQSVSAADFLGTAIYPWLIMAANPNLSAIDIERFLEVQARETRGARRPASWIRKHRWMFEPPNAARAAGAKRNADGQAERAFGIMRENPSLSSQKLAELLRERGIPRSRDWVRRHRCC